MEKINEIRTLTTNFLKCGVTGWCLEVVFTSLDSVMQGDWRLMGKTSLLMFPIYGMGALLGPIGKAIDKWVPNGENTLNRTDKVLRHGTMYMVLIFTAEYICGALLRSKGICPWDYTGRNTNINGLIRLDFAPLWFGTGLLFERITSRNPLKLYKNFTQNSRQ